MALMPLSMAESTSNSDEFVWQPGVGVRITFDVFRKGKSMGQHIVSFAENEYGDLVATTDVDLEVKIGPFTAFQYQLDSQETWRAGQLIQLIGKTNDDGDKSYVNASTDGSQLRIDGSAFQGVALPSIIPSSHWNINQVRSTEMLSTESGEVLDMTVVPKGRETIEVAGQSIEADRFLLDSDIDIDLWHDGEGRWVKLTFDARGQTIEYRLSDLY